MTEDIDKSRVMSLFAKLRCLSNLFAACTHGIGDNLQRHREVPLRQHVG